MTTKRATSKATEILDPTLPFTEIEIGGKTYRMCFDLRSLMKIERELRIEGHPVNLADSLRDLNLEGTMVMFAASLRRFHPETSYDEAMDLIDLPTVVRVQNAVLTAWAEALPKPQPKKEGAEDPPKAAL